MEPSDDYLVFPNEPVLATFRHRWVLVRNPRPMVPVFQHSKLPRPNRSSEENARLCSVYFRPWTLHAGHAMLPHVPHLLQLAMYPQPLSSTATTTVTEPRLAEPEVIGDTAPESKLQKTENTDVRSEPPAEDALSDTQVRRRITRKTSVLMQTPAEIAQPSQCHATTATKRRVTKKSSERAPMTSGETAHALKPTDPITEPIDMKKRQPVTKALEPTWSSSWAQYIRGNVVSQHDAQLITNFLTATLARTAGDDDSSDEEAEAPGEFEGEPICTSLEAVHAVIRGADNPEHVDASSSKSRQQRARAIRRVRTAWSSELPEEAAASFVDASGNLPKVGVFDYKKAIRKTRKAEDQPPMPFEGKTQPRVRVYEHGSVADIDRWLRSFEVPLATISLKHMCVFL